MQGAIALPYRLWKASKRETRGRDKRKRQEEDPLFSSTFLSHQEKKCWVLGSLQRMSIDAVRFRRLQGCSNCISCTCKLLTYLRSDLIVRFRDNAFVSKINFLSKCLPFSFVWFIHNINCTIFFSLKLSSTYLDFRISLNILICNINCLEIII